VHPLPVAETEHPDHAEITQPVETTEHMDRADSTRTVQEEAYNLVELTHGLHASCNDRAPQLEKLEIAHEPNISHTDRATSRTEQLTPELKPLPANLRYEFLVPDKSFLVIISADLEPDRTATLLEKLKAHTGAIECSIMDLKEILWILLMQEFDRVVVYPPRSQCFPGAADPPFTAVRPLRPLPYRLVFIFSYYFLV
jgi:hypothetical protein